MTHVLIIITTGVISFIILLLNMLGQPMPGTVSNKETIKTFFTTWVIWIALVYIVWFVCRLILLVIV